MSYTRQVRRDELRAARHHYTVAAAAVLDDVLVHPAATARTLSVIKAGTDKELIGEKVRQTIRCARWNRAVICLKGCL